MSDPKRINEMDILEKEQISAYRVLDFLYHYEWTQRLILAGSQWGGSWNPLVKLIVWCLYMFFLWVPLCLGYRFCVFFGCSIIRLLTNKGGEKGFKVNIFYVTTYVVIIFLVYIPILIPTYWKVSSTTFLEWLKVI
jgi:hypothetical protein